ncbi:hypothetical protein [Siminovitchia terrae]|uniref:Uncharacterized protein n=1 Tax=Siminovitchia terrae TaxID=1914933 RepID=A0A429X163_SIMTE|nr:hypothetical protein [Siminovitchia terrae]RST56955.1 hypothetical protein D5F11_025370 [Siminovitchia terrae]
MKNSQQQDQMEELEKKNLEIEAELNQYLENKKEIDEEKEEVESTPFQNTFMFIMTTVLVLIVVIKLVTIFYKFIF